MSWQKLSSKIVYKNKWMEVTEDEVITNFGKQLTYGVVHKDPFALVVPWDGEHLYLVGQYRYPVDQFSWEFPQGHFQNGSIIETAKGELKEETGLITENLEEFGQFNLACGHHSQVCHMFLATDLKQGKQDLEESEEGLLVKKFTLSDFKEMIASDIIKDGPTITAFGTLIAKDIIHNKLSWK